jgi:hypothetical protein
LWDEVAAGNRQPASVPPASSGQMINPAARQIHREPDLYGFHLFRITYGGTPEAVQIDLQTKSHPFS